MTLSSDGSRVEGLGHGDGSALRAVAVVLATGTFLGGRLFRGEERMEGGRIGEAGAHRLAQQLRGVNLPMERLKPGTPPRLDGRPIDLARVGEQASDRGEGANWSCCKWETTRHGQATFGGIPHDNDQSNAL